MVVKLRDAPIASLTVFCALKHMSFANIAIVFIVVNIETDFTIASNLSFSFKIYSGIRGVNFCSLVSVSNH